MNEQSIQVKSGCNLDVPEGYVWRVEPDPNHLAVNRPYDSLYRMYLMKKWQYPEWLGGAGVAMDEYGDWDVYYGVPQCMDDGWYGSTGMLIRKHTFPLWEPPHCTDWKQSWHPNPRAK